MSLNFFSLLADLPFYHVACAVLADYYLDHDLPFAAAYWRQRAKRTKPPEGALSLEPGDYLRVLTYRNRIEHHEGYYHPDGPPDIYPIEGIVHAMPCFAYTKEALLHLTYDHGEVHASPLTGHLPVYNLIGDDLPEAITEDGIHLSDGVFHTPRPALKAYSGYAARTPIYLTVDGEAFVGDLHLGSEVCDLTAEITYASTPTAVLNLTLIQGEDGSRVRRVEL
jgi:hypothetical protein